MENIIINFTADGQGLQPGIDALDQLEQKDKDVAEQAQKTMSAYEKRDKAVTNSGKTAVSQLDKMSKSFKDLDKSITGGAYTKALKQLQTEIGNTGDEFKQLSLAVDFAKKRLAGMDQNSADFKVLSEEIAASEEVLKTFGNELQENETKAQSFKARLRELKQTLLEMEDAGQENSAAYRQMAIEAARLEDQIGDTQARIRTMASDTFAFDAVIQGLTGITAAFSVGQGAAALFGDESEDVQKALLKVNAAMAVLQGLQSIQNTLQAESAVSLAVENAQRRIAVLQTNLQAAAESRNVVVKIAATAAQKALNFVMAASPAGLLLVTIGAIAGALIYFTSGTREAAAAQIKFNDALAEANELLSAEEKAIENTGKKVTAEMKARGESDNAVAREEIKNTERRIDARKNALAVLAQTLNDEKVINELSAEDYKKLNDKYLELQFSIQDAESDAYQQRKDLQRKEYLDGIKSAQAYAESRVLIFRQGSRQELQAQIEAIRVKAAAERASNPNLTPGERVAIEREALRQIAELQFNFDQKARENAIKGLQAKADLEKEDSRQRLDRELTALDLQKAAELQTTAVVNGQVIQLKELTEQQKQEIEDRYLKLSSDKIREFARKDAEYQIQQRIAFLNGSMAQLQISADAATNEKLLEMKKQLIDEQARLEVLSIDASVHNEETRREMVKAVYAKALADKIQLEKDKAKAEIDYQSKLVTGNYNREAEMIRRNNELTGLSFFNKTKDAQAYFDAIKNGIDFEMAANEDRRKKDLISEEEYQLKKQELQEKSDDNEFARKKDHQARMDAITALAQQTAINLTNFAFSIAKKNYDAEEARVQKLYEQKKISETEYNNQLKTLRRKQDQDAKAQALFQTLIQQGPTILKGFQQGGFAGVAAAFTLFFSLLASLQSAQVPAYKDGEILINGPGTETSDSIPARLSRNESVIKASMSKKHTEALRAINEDRYEEYLKTVELPKFYSGIELPTLPEYVMSNTAGIDYDRLGEVLAQKIAENPQYGLHFDENGFYLSVKQGNDRIEYVNKKLST